MTELHAFITTTRADARSAISVRLIHAGGLRGAFYVGSSAVTTATLSTAGVPQCLGAGGLGSARAYEQPPSAYVEASWQQVLALNSTPAAAPASRGFSATWQGLIRPSVGGMYSISMGRSEQAYEATAAAAAAGEGEVFEGARAYGGERLRLWIDNQLVIDQWTSLPAAPAGAAALRANTYHDIRIVWKEELDRRALAHANRSVHLQALVA